MSDKIEKIGKSLIQHGQLNKRVYLMRLHKEDKDFVINYIEELARANQYEKIFAKVPESLADYFKENNYQIEASVPNFFKGRENGLFLAKYFSEERKNEELSLKLRENIEIAKNKKLMNITEEEFIKQKIEKMSKSDAVQMTELYREVFKTYPFPIYDPEYIKQTMDENVVYYGIKDNNRIVAIASCEMDEENKNSEMTDFAVHSDYRGKNLALLLLYFMEKEMREQDILTFYTIARAKSLPMNITFAKTGYKYAGSLIKNTNISGQMETMNVWYKK